MNNQEIKQIAFKTLAERAQEKQIMHKRSGNGILHKYVHTRLSYVKPREYDRMYQSCLQRK